MLSGEHAALISRSIVVCVHACNVCLDCVSSMEYKGNTESGYEKRVEIASLLFEECPQPTRLARQHSAKGVEIVNQIHL